MQLENKTIWITGASSGIGKALCFDLAARRCRLVLSARHENTLEAVRQQLPNPDQHWVVPLDLGQADQLQNIVNKALPDIGEVHALINNGGVSQRSFAAETDLAVDRQLMEVNYLGTVAMSKALLPHFMQCGSGTIMSVASVAGKVGSQLRSGYSGSKHAVIGYMDSLRAELHQHGIHVLVACPGWVRTDLSINALDAQGQPNNAVGQASRKGISAEDCADQIVHALQQDKAEVIIGKGLSGIAPLMKRIAPGLVAWVNRREFR